MERQITINGKTYVWNDRAQSYGRWVTMKGGHVFIQTSPEESAQIVGHWTNDANDEKSQNFAIQGGSLDGADVPIGYVPSRDELFAPYPKGFRYIANRRELIRFAKSELGIDGSELFRDVDLDVANAINCELMRAREMFGFLPAIKKLKVFNDDDLKDWAEYDPNDQSLSIRAAHPKSGEIMTAPAWRDLIKKIRSKGGCSTGDWRHIIWHEIGHAYEAYFIKRNAGLFRRRVNWIQIIWDNSKTRIYVCLSSLAATNYRQLIAEAFCVVVSGDKTNELANDIMDTLFTGGKNARNRS